MNPEHTLYINFKKKIALKKRITFSVQAGAPYNSKFTDVTFMVKHIDRRALISMPFRVKNSVFMQCKQSVLDLFHNVASLTIKFSSRTLL